MALLWERISSSIFFSIRKVIAVSGNTSLQCQCLHPVSPKSLFLSYTLFLSVSSFLYPLLALTIIQAASFSLFSSFFLRTGSRLFSRAAHSKFSSPTMISLSRQQCDAKSVSLSVPLSMSVFFSPLCLCLTLYLSVCVCLFFSESLSLYLSLYLSICLGVSECLSVCLCLYTHLLL